MPADTHEREVKSIAREKILIDGGTQVRAELDMEHVKDMLAVVDNLPPLEVFYDGTNYWLADGFHRMEAMARVKRSIECHVHAGTKDDAAFFACGANKGHGLKLNPGDKRRAVELALRLRPEASYGLIAAHVGVDRSYVGKIVKELKQGGEGDRLGNSPQSDGDSESETQIPQSEERPSERKGRDGRTYNADKIGEANARRASDNLAKRAKKERSEALALFFGGVDPETSIDDSWRGTSVTSLALGAALKESLRAASLQTAGDIFDRYVSNWEQRNTSEGGLQQAGLSSTDIGKVKLALISLFQSYAKTDAAVESVPEGIEADQPAVDQPTMAEFVARHNLAIEQLIDAMEAGSRRISEAMGHRRNGDEHVLDNPASAAHASWSGTCGAVRDAVRALKNNLIVETSPGEFASASAVRSTRALNVG